MTFETPKGPMTFRKEDHQALQVMYHFKVKANGKDENDLLELVDTDPGRQDADPGPQQALILRATPAGPLSTVQLTIRRRPRSKRAG